MPTKFLVMSPAPHMKWKVQGKPTAGLPLRVKNQPSQGVMVEMVGVPVESATSPLATAPSPSAISSKSTFCRSSRLFATGAVPAMEDWLSCLTISTA